jgi:predicted nucleic acid-binding Zn ribbon protein
MDYLCGRCKTLNPSDEFNPSQRSNGKWCKACLHEWYRSRYTPRTAAGGDPRRCDRCGETYTPKQRRLSMYCSFFCKDRARKDQQILDRLASKPFARRCVWCGAAIPQTMRSDAMFCSAVCNSAAHRTMRSWRRRSGERAPLKPRKNPLPSFIDIADRDQWKCGICGKPVNRRLEYPAPLAGSLDHLLPVSRGGSHDPSNLQLAHFRCNWSKRADPANDRLRLIG